MGKDSDYEDELDSFHKQRDHILLETNEEDEEESDSEPEAILDLELDSEDEDEEEEDEKFQEKLDKMDQQWGNKKSKYYSVDYDDDLDSDDEAAGEEEEEVKRLQRKRIEKLAKEDFEDEEELAEANKTGYGNKKISKKSDAGLLEELNRDLDEISLDLEDGSVEVESVSKDLSSLTKEEKLEIIMNESPELVELLEDLKLKIAEIREKIQPTMEKVKGNKLPTSKGMSFLEVKYHLLLNYCINIAFYLLLKAEGKRVKDHPVITQLVKIRTVLEKLKPLDQKLKHQIDKLMKTAVNGKTESDDAKKFKPNPELMGAEAEEDGSENTVYKIPKLAEAHFEEPNQKKKKQMERLKKKAAKSSMMKFIQQEFSDKPEELAQAGMSQSRMEDEEEKHKQQYEEDMYIRLRLSKQDKKKLEKKKRKFDDELADLAEFNDIAPLENQEVEIEKPTPSMVLKKTSVKSIIHNLSQKKKEKSGDNDLPYEEDVQPVKRMRKEKERTYQPESFSEDEFYEDISKKKRDVENENYRRIIRDDTLQDGAKRAITKQIQSNRGLTRARPKDTKTPHTRLRKKYENALKRRRGMVRKMADKSKPYQGETTGINTRVTRSVKL